MARNAVIVFCKPPVAGRVKTRLIGALSARQAAEVHVACVHDTVAMVNKVRGAEKWLYYAILRRPAVIGLTVPAEANPAINVRDRAVAWRSVSRLQKRLPIGEHWMTSAQRGLDLGERMRNAIEGQLQADAGKVVIVGTDSPWMGHARIAHALRLLDKTDVVLGPSEDGGYYLIGARRLVPKMFAGIQWGTEEVLSKTLRALRATRTSFRLLKKEFDLDRPEDLQRVARMAARGKLRAPALSKWVRESSRRLEPVRQNKRPRPGRG